MRTSSVDRAWAGVLPGVLCLLIACAAPAQTTIHYACAESEGPRLADDGPLKADAVLVSASSDRISNVCFTPSERDRWFPLLVNGAQVRNIKPKSDKWVGAADEEIPLIYHAGADFEVDYTNGRAKALPGGRMEPGKTYLLTLVAPNDGPRRVRTDKGMALQFDGVDDYADGGDPERLRTVTSLTLELAFQALEKWNPSATLIGKGEVWSLGFEDNHVLFRHAGLKSAAGRPADATRSVNPTPVKPGTWHRLRAAWTSGSVVVELDGKEVARTDGVAPGSLTSTGPLRVGGTVDPRFFAGILADVRITFDD